MAITPNQMEPVYAGRKREPSSWRGSPIKLCWLVRLQRWQVPKGQSDAATENEGSVKSSVSSWSKTSSWPQVSSENHQAIHEEKAAFCSHCRQWGQTPTDLNYSQSGKNTSRISSVHLHTFCSRNRVRAHCFWGDWHSQEALLLLGLWGQPFLKTLNVVGLSWETCFCHEYILGRPGFSGIKNRGLDLLVFTLFILPEKVYARVLELLERTVYPTVEY